MALQLDIHDDVNSFLLFHEEVDPHGGFEQHVSLPEFVMFPGRGCLLEGWNPASLPILITVWRMVWRSGSGV